MHGAGATPFLLADAMNRSAANNLKTMAARPRSAFAERQTLESLAGGAGAVERLSRHFDHKWRSRVGETPPLEIVNRLIRESVKIQHCKDLTDRYGRPFRQLAMYWNTQLQIIITVDQIRGVAVSVLTPRDKDRQIDPGAG